MIRRAGRLWCIVLVGGVMVATGAAAQVPRTGAGDSAHSAFRPGRVRVLPRLRPDPVPLSLRVALACYTATWPQIDSLIRRGRSPRLLIDGRDAGLLTEYRRWCPGRALKRTDIVGMWYLIPDAAADVWGSAGENGMVRVELPERAAANPGDTTRPRRRAGGKRE